MPRRSRIRIAGYPLHVIQRGVNRSDCFDSDRDRRVYLGILDELGDMYGCAIHAYVLMTNHVHLLMTPSRSDGPSLLMKHMGQRFAQYINRKHGRSGPLWEGRFKSCVVDTATYLMSCYRYIELNPVRAGMVSCPGEYEWSSFRTNAGGEPSLFLAPHSVYLALGASNNERRAAYRQLFVPQMRPEELKRIRDATNSGSALGSESFVDQIERETGYRARNGRPGRPNKRAKGGSIPPIGNRATSPV